MDHTSSPYANRCCWIREPEDPAPGMMTLPLARPYFAHPLHMTWRNISQQQRGARLTHCHDVYHIVLVSGGSGRFVIGEEEVEAAPGRLFITSPGEWHSFGCAEGETTEYCEATFEFKDRAGRVLQVPFHEVLAAWSGQPCPRIGIAEAGADLHLLISQEIERMVGVGFERPPYYRLLLNECLARIFMGLFTHLYRTKPLSGEVSDPMRPVREYIHRHYQEPLSLPQLAAIAGCTPNYLSRRFKQKFGRAPIAYQHRLRIQAAAGLLGTTEHPIKQIAAIVGYSDVYFFSRIFKKIQGVPPGEHRRRARQPD